MNDPICGNCAKPLSKHYIEMYSDERREYCFTTTNGDVFTDEPRDSEILNMLIDRMPAIHEALVSDWKREHGHAA